MITALALLLTSAALGQEEACPEVYDNGALAGDLDAVDDHFRTFDVAAARTELSRIHRMMLCLDQPVDRDGLARLARQLALAFFFDQDENAMVRWGHLAKHVSPDLPWYADIPREHPFRASLTGLSMPELGGPDQALVVPKKGAVLWNGLPAPGTKLPVEMPGLVQVMDKKGDLVGRWWQDGSAWPESALTDGHPLASPEPRGWTLPSPDPVHGVNAARALFETPVASAVVAEPLEPEIETPVYSKAELSEAQEEDVVGAYVDPFAEARKRAIRRDVFENTTTNQAGDNITVRTEVMTFKRDRSGGEPITYEIYVYWSKDFPDWRQAAVRNLGKADESFLQDWTGDSPPSDRYGDPLVYVSFAVAQGYCHSFGTDLPQVSRTEVHEGLTWEFRIQDTQPVRVGPRGKVQGVQPRQTFADTGFRCVE